MGAHLIPNDPPAAPPLNRSYVQESITPEAAEFAEVNGLTAALPKISDAIRRYIPGLEGIFIVRVVDPEIPDYIVFFFEIQTSASVEELRDPESKVWDTMIEILPPEQLAMVCTTFRF